ncbi:DNA-binding response regulator [Phaeobacter inhibens]|uniref:response regulator transcription factor n=1 Tax=Phaeobacter inhibens TaxID=221822 RepID=UPI00275B5A2A|nr:response regulator transcription factor [Phaeobacter inhibens]GLO69106.1 DNA-binding response regulator [Phaeobacter inhibens]
MTGTIIVADDHPVFREALSRIVRQVIKGSIVEVADFDALLGALEGGQDPKLLLLDLVFPGFNGTSTLASLRKQLPRTPIVVVTMNQDEQVARSIMAAGANGYVSKTALPEEMKRAFESVLEGELVYLAEGVQESSALPTPVHESLSQRQFELMVYLAQGKSNKEIARELGISPHTVRAHMSVLFEKLDITSRSAAAAYAAKYGLS